MKRLVRLSFLSSALALGGLAAGNSVATVTSAAPFTLDGHAVNTPGVTTFPLVVGDVVTTASGPAVLYFQDGSVIKLGKNSSIKVSGVETEPKLVLMSGTLDYKLMPGSNLAVTNLDMDRKQNAQPIKAAGAGRNQRSDQPMTVSYKLATAQEQSLGAAPVTNRSPDTAVKIKLPFNTGVKNDGTLAEPGSLDPHYTSVVSSQQVYVVTNPAYSSKWLGANGTSAWVGPDPKDGSSVNGGQFTMDYTVNFDLTGYEASSVVLEGRCATSGALTDILINGMSVGKSIPGGTFDRWTDFRIDKGFVSGMNTVDFRYTNAGGPGAVRVEFTNAMGYASLKEATPYQTSQTPAQSGAGSTPNANRPLFGNPKFLIPLAGVAAAGASTALLTLPPVSRRL
jgi:hypothetical protein